MVRIYVRWIKAGRMTIKDVPARWQKAVEAELKKDKLVAKLKK